MSKWWFSRLFFRKKKTVQPEIEHLDFNVIENTSTLQCPTRDRVRGPVGRKRPTRATSAMFPQRVQNADSLVAGEKSCNESFFRKSDGSDFNQTNSCSESAVCNSVIQRDAIIHSDQRTPSGFSITFKFYNFILLYHVSYSSLLFSFDHSLPSSRVKMF